ncbi:class I SAM-dependent methyltransferase [Aestuariivirga sp.]|uniref:class I SAM-dependent methyltransferase n=1 Tax=Aestuariivirga sp. TaxID=2650926 RepID=UPI0039E5501A
MLILDTVLKRLIRKGDLKITDWSGTTYSYGDGGQPKVHIEIDSAVTARKLALDPDLNLGECYMDGGLKILEGTIYDFLALAMQNTERQGKSHWIHNVVHKGRVVTRRISQHNPVGKAKQNVAHHYDLSGALYDLFLDVDRQYSCAYFETSTSTLEEAQLAKKRHLAAKLDIKPGMKVLDIGSGWGGLGLYLAEICGAEVTGVTLSEEQHKLSNERAAQRGISDRVQFLLKDYRHLEQKFDRIVSVGMFEHVGIGHYPEFFSKVATLLKDDGAAVLHSINRSDGPGATSAWINRHIFPGGYIPALSEVIPHLEQQGLYVTDIEILRLHYAETLRHWARRFADNRERAKALYDERFCRMWEFYLAGSECAFRFGGMNNFQIQFGLNQHVLPMTRDYITAAEEKLRKIENKTPKLRKVS